MTPSPVLCIAGKNQIAIDVLDSALRRGDWRISVLPNEGDDGVGGWQPSFRRAAEERFVPVVDLEWAEAEPELCFLSVEYDRIIRPERFQDARLFNIHFSLLPKYRGCNTAIWPILNGESEHGVTLHWIDSGIDSGAIVDQRSFGIGEMTAKQVYFQCMAEGAALVDEWLERLVVGEVGGITQDESGATTFRRADLDFSRKAFDRGSTVAAVLRTVRAFHFPEYQYAEFEGRPVDAAVPAPHAAPAPPGTCIELSPMNSRLWVADGAVDLRFAG